MQYDRWVASLYSAFADPWLRDIRTHVLQFSEIQAGNMALDICCGTGEQSISYAQEGIIAVGIDISPEMIKMAERKRLKKGLTNVAFQTADAQSLPFQSSLFDCVSISLALHEIEGPLRHRIIAEMARVLKKSGVLVLIDFQTPLPDGLFSSFIRTVEFIAGHADLLKDFVDNGGSDGLLAESQLRVDRRGLLKRGHLGIIRARKI